MVHTLLYFSVSRVRLHFLKLFIPSKTFYYEIQDYENYGKDPTPILIATPFYMSYVG